MRVIHYIYMLVFQYLTVAYSTRTISIVAASAISVVLIGGAYVLSGPWPFTKTADAESTHDLLVTYAAKDTDNDGLPDWEEALYGTDPNNPHSVDPALSDGQAVAEGKVKPKFATATTTTLAASDIPGVDAGPTTLTDQFAQQLFKQYLTNRGATPPTPDQIATLVETGVTQLEQSNTIPNAFNAGEERVVGSGPDALKTYAVAVERVFLTNQVPEQQSEILYFADAVNKNDDASLAKVSAIGKSYGTIGEALIKIPVPIEVASLHLELANALMRMNAVTLDFAAIRTDPLRAMLGLAQYEQDGAGVLQALSSIHSLFVNEGVTFGQGEAGGQFYSSTVEASEASTTP